MDYQSVTEIAAEIRAELKAKFPACKFSVTSRDANEITVALMSAPASPFADLKCGRDGEYTHDGTYAQLNHYYIETTCNGYHLTPEAVEMLRQVKEIANRKNWDNSDPQTDYFDVNYYLHLEVGRWNKPFAVKA